MSLGKALLTKCSFGCRVKKVVGEFNADFTANLKLLSVTQFLKFYTFTFFQII